MNKTAAITKYLETHETKIIPWAIYLVGLALIIDTLLELTYSVLNYDSYQFMFRWLSPQMIFLRYCISVIWRCVFILALAGVCLRMDIFRKWLIALTWAGVVVLFWKHPYQAIINANIYAHSNPSYFSVVFQVPWSSQHYYPYFLMAMLQLWIIDLAKAILILKFFSYPRVRQFFR